MSSEDKEIAKQSGEIPKATKEIGDGISLEYLILKILALGVIVFNFSCLWKKKKVLTKSLSFFVTFLYFDFFFTVSESVLAGHGVPKYYMGSKDDLNLGGFSTSISSILYSTTWNHRQ